MDIYANCRFAVPLNEQGIIDYWNNEEDKGTVVIFDFPPEEVKAFYGEVEYEINKICGTFIGCCEPGTIENQYLESCLEYLAFKGSFPAFCAALKLAIQCKTCVEVEI